MQHIAERVCRLRWISLLQGFAVVSRFPVGAHVLHIASPNALHRFDKSIKIPMEQELARRGTVAAQESDSCCPATETHMQAFLRDFIDRLSRTTEFANTGSLGEALRLMAKRHLVEVERRQLQTVQRRARKLMQRPRQFHPSATEPALRHQYRRSRVLVAGCLAPQSGNMKSAW